MECTKFVVYDKEYDEYYSSGYESMTKNLCNAKMYLREVDASYRAKVTRGKFLAQNPNVLVKKVLVKVEVIDDSTS